MDEEKLAISPLFTGLTRPPMIMGVTLDYISICFLLTIVAFIGANSPFYLLLYLPLHVFGWVACKIDVNIFRIILKRLECQNVPNRKIWGCQSYEPF